MDIYRWRERERLGDHRLSIVHWPLGLLCGVSRGTQALQLQGTLLRCHGLPPPVVVAWSASPVMVAIEAIDFQDRDSTPDPNV